MRGGGEEVKEEGADPQLADDTGRPSTVIKGGGVVRSEPQLVWERADMDMRDEDRIEAVLYRDEGVVPRRS